MFIRDKNITEYAGVATSGDYVFVAYVGEDPDTLRYVTHLLRYDVLNATSPNGMIGKIIEIGSMDDLALNDYGLCVYANNQAMFFDYDLELASTLMRANDILSVFSFDDGFAIIDENEDIFLLDNFYDEGMILSEELFPQKSGLKLLHVTQKNGSLYIKHKEDSSYVSVFDLKRGEWAEVLSKTGVNEFDEIGTADKSYYPDIDKTVYQVIASDDGKYYAVLNYNGELTIFDRKTRNAVKKLYIDGVPDKFVYLKKQKSYVLFGGYDEYFFDRNFKYYASLPYGSVYGSTDDNEQDIVLANGRNDYFRVKIKSYKEVIKKADEILGNYEPEQKIIDKYNITLRKRKLTNELKSLLGESLQNK